MRAQSLRRKEPVCPPPLASAPPLLKAIRTELGRGITVTERKAYTRISHGKATLVYLSGGNGKVRLDLGPNGKRGKLVVASEDDIAGAVEKIAAAANEQREERKP